MAVYDKLLIGLLLSFGFYTTEVAAKEYTARLTAKDKVKLINLISKSHHVIEKTLEPNSGCGVTEYRIVKENGEEDIITIIEDDSVKKSPQPGWIQKNLSAQPGWVPKGGVKKTPQPGWIQK